MENSNPEFSYMDEYDDEFCIPSEKLKNEIFLNLEKGFKCTEPDPEPIG